jgi:hypothetical protein
LHRLYLRIDRGRRIVEPIRKGGGRREKKGKDFAFRNQQFSIWPEWLRAGTFYRKNPCPEKANTSVRLSILLGVTMVKKDLCNL